MKPRESLKKRVIGRLIKKVSELLEWLKKLNGEDSYKFNGG